jgi:L-lactate dehydrogenase (cytochrome)
MFMSDNMQLNRCSSVEQLNPTLVDTRGLSLHATTVLSDSLGLGVYDPLVSLQEMVRAKL